MRLTRVDAGGVHRIRCASRRARMDSTTVASRPRARSRRSAASSCRPRFLELTRDHLRTTGTTARSIRGDHRGLAPQIDSPPKIGGGEDPAQDVDGLPQPGQLRSRAEEVRRLAEVHLKRRRYDHHDRQNADEALHGMLGSSDSQMIDGMCDLHVVRYEHRLGVRRPSEPKTRSGSSDCATVESPATG